MYIPGSGYVLVLDGSQSVTITEVFHPPVRYCVFSVICTRFEFTSNDLKVIAVSFQDTTQPGSVMDPGISRCPVTTSPVAGVGPGSPGSGAGGRWAPTNAWQDPEARVCPVGASCVVGV